MATSLNKMIDGSKLFPGYKFLVTVDTYSENVVLVTGFIGSRKYKGALLDLPCNYARGCATDNVFASDFSSKNSYSFTNMAITNYYSHKKFRNNSDTTLFSVNKRAKDNYICTNCKMKISYFSKKESKSPPIETGKITTNSTRSDITVLKQTLSYPDDLSDDKIPPTPNTAQHNFISISNIPEKTHKTLKRKKHQTNHVIPDKKSKILVTESERNSLFKNTCKSHENIIETPQKSEKKKTDGKLSEILFIKNSQLPEKKTTEKEEKLSELVIINDIQMEKTEENVENIEKTPDKISENVGREDLQTGKTLEKILEKLCSPECNVPIEEPQQNCSETFKETEMELENFYGNLFDVEDVSETQNFDEYRPMPLSLLKLNHLNSLDNDKTSEDSLRECPKPKKIWMKMIENEDIQKLSDLPTPMSSESVHPILKNKSIKSSHSNRSYKIKQTFYDKVILTIDKRPEKHKLDPRKSENNNPTRDIYTFSDESEIIMNDLPPQPPPPPLPPLSETNLDILPRSNEDFPAVNLIEDIKTDESIKSSPSSSSKSSSLSTRISLKNLSDVNSVKSEDVVNPDENNKVTVKMEPDSTTTENSNLMVSVISSCENNNGIAFNLNDIVWAKITGYPFWPAKIISFSQEEDNFIGCIEWYAWNEISFIKVNNLFHFNQNFPSKYQKRNRNGKYQEAVKLAKFDCGMIDTTPPPVTITTTTAATTTTGSSSVKGSDTDGSDSNAASYTSASL